MNGPYPDPTRRRLISLATILGTMMVALDGTIANVALTHIQSSVSASSEQIIWVLTSYLIAAAIATPLTGWLADRMGRKKVMVASVIGFVVASVACAASTNLEELVIFRMLQGVCGAAMIPLGQTVMLDINPPERQGKAMAMYGMGSVLGPVIGPTLGGYLTDSFNWRWVFLINVPIGVIAAIGMIVFMSETKPDKTTKFDLLGFTFLSVFIGSLQLLLDRGQQLDWFSSWEIRLEAIVMALFGYLTVVQMFTARNSFVKPAILRDRNFIVGALISVVLGMVLYAVMALLSPMLQRLMGYPVMLTGIVTAPRGIGTIISMMLVGQVINRVDPRALIMAGLGIACVSLFMMSKLSLEMGQSSIVIVGFIQGLGAGLIFVPASTMVFATLDPALRNEGAALYSLTRSLGGSLAISIMQSLTLRNSGRVEARLVENIRPDNPILQMRYPDFDFGQASMVAMVQRQLEAQAAMVGFLNSYWIMAVLTALSIPFALLMRPSKLSGRGAPMMLAD